MIAITAKFRVKPEHTENWPTIAKDFTDATRGEAGCLWFDWSRSLEDPNEFVLIEAFADDDAGAAHVNSDHFKAAQRDLPPYLVATPKIINVKTDAEGWGELGELAVTD